MLVVSDLDKKIRIKVDALDYTIGKVLLIECEDRQWKLVAYLLKSLNKIEINYEIYNKEMLKVIKELKN